MLCADAERWLATHDAARASGSEAVFAVTLGTDGTLVGSMGLHLFPQHDRAELGYWIGKPFWGRGYATDAARAVVRWGFESLGLERIFAYHMTANPASGRVMEKMGVNKEQLDELARRLISELGGDVPPDLEDLPGLGPEPGGPDEPDTPSPSRLPCALTCAPV